MYHFVLLLFVATALQDIICTLSCKSLFLNLGLLEFGLESCTNLYTHGIVLKITVRQFFLDGLVRCGCDY